MDDQKSGVVPALDLAKFGVSADRGFLPAEDPMWIVRLHPYWEATLFQLPKLIAAKRMSMTNTINARTVVKPVMGELLEREVDALMRDLSFLTQAYIWEDFKNPKKVLPANIAVDFHEIAKRTGRPPILAYKSYVLDNWYRCDSKMPIGLGNIVLIRNFLGGLDEEWFILVHVQIEAEAGPALAAIGQAQKAAAENNRDELLRQLRIMAGSEEKMLATLKRMPENCDPYTYFIRVRPFIHGFELNPIVYEGVEEYGGQPQNFSGQTGAQSSIAPSLDAALGIAHDDGPLSHHLANMRRYMPPGHNAFIDAVIAGPSIRNYVAERASSDPELAAIFNHCVHCLWRFRDQHLKYAESYIQRQSQTNPYNTTSFGTGGTPFIEYLKKHRDDTKGIGE